MISSEVDVWTNRNYVLALDSDYSWETLSSFVDEKIEMAINEANEDLDGSCSEEKLRLITYGKLVGYNGIHDGVTESYAKNSFELFDDRYCLNFSQSVYKDFSLTESFALHYTADAMGCSFNAGGYVVGTDKIGHFFAQGYNYFYKIKLNSSFKEAITYGSETEEGYFGLLGTGIFSFADLNANFSGMKFWSRLTEVYSSSKKSYAVCQLGKWVKNKNFDWRDYINPLWDESINVSYFRTNKMTEKFLKQLSLLSIDHLTGKELCRQEVAKLIKEKKMKQVKNLVSPRCALEAKDEMTAKDRDYFYLQDENLSDESKKSFTLKKFLYNFYKAITEELI